MKNLLVKVIDDTVHYFRKTPYLIGEITINDFYEEFEMQLVWWKREDYERQWKEGLERIKTDDKSCLITRIQNPFEGPFIEWWVLHKKDNKIYIQNQWLFHEYYEELIGAKPFTVDNCYDFVPPYKSPYLEDGTKFSEWIVDIE